MNVPACAALRFHGAGSDGAQGFHFSHPVPAPDFTRLLAAARA
ncbi:MAG: hypothetical protein AAB153_05990 [Pseudomonadota bacterium]